MHGKVITTRLTDVPAAVFILLNLFTDEFCRFVWPLVDESLKGLLHCVDESLAPWKTAVRNVVHLVLKVQQVLNHVLVFFWSTHYLSTKGLREETVSTRFIYVWLKCGPLCLFLRKNIPLYNPSRTAAVWEVLLSPCWRAGKGGSAQSRDSHPAGCSNLQNKYYTICITET